MKAFVIRAKHDAAVVDMPMPKPGPGEALVRVRMAGICGSDLHAYEGTQPFFVYPQIPGHEVVGEIVQLGPERTLMRLAGRVVQDDLAPGDRVVLDPSMPCGHCFPCRNGRYNCCENMRVLGVHAPGALAEYFAAPVECLHRVPEELADETAALVEPLSIGVQACNRGRVAAGESVLVIGAGTIGLCVMLVARSRNARVIVSDLSLARRLHALEMGAHAAVDPQRPGFYQELLGLCGGHGPALVVEAAGTPATVLQALEVVAASGRVVLLGLISDELHLPGNLLVKKELDFVGSRLHGGTIPQALRLLAEGRAHVAPLVTHRIGLEDTEKALHLMGHHPDGILKALVRMG